MSEIDIAHAEHRKEFEDNVRAIMDNDAILDELVKKLLQKSVAQAEDAAAKWLWRRVIQAVGAGLVLVGIWIIIKVNILGALK